MEQKKLNIDKRRRYYVVLDTETCPIDNMVQDVNPKNMLVYDIGFAIIDKRGRVYDSRSFVIYETFFGESDKMQSSYYAQKIPQYLEDLRNGSRKCVKFSTARRVLLDLMHQYNIDTVIAHNMRFDCCSLNTTMQYLTSGHFKYFFPYGTTLWDTMRMAQSTICKQSGYKRFCAENNYLCKNGSTRATAEVLYRYISGIDDFAENHTGLEDVLIETAIFAHCMRQHKPMRKLCFTPKVA
jgi:hypothetical protein